jgi:hypothetical protein
MIGWVGDMMPHDPLIPLALPSTKPGKIVLLPISLGRLTSTEMPTRSSSGAEGTKA